MSDNCYANELVPAIAKVFKIVDETPDIKTFFVSLPDGTKPFTPQPGQLGMVSLLHIGEAMFSVTAQGETHLEFAIKKCGLLTDALHEIKPGQMIGVRGPYGNGFPIERCLGKDLLFIGGGIGLAPVRSLITYCLGQRDDFGTLDIIYGARSIADLCFKEDLFSNWPRHERTKVHVTVDQGDPDCSCHIGFVPAFLEKINPDPQDKMVILCGPPIMIKFCLEVLTKIGYQDEQIITTLEMRMKCGIGKCGRCNIGSKFVCLDGPVFSMADLKNLPGEF
jgi:NAD(P)H-flavin reductase